MGKKQPNQTERQRGLMEAYEIMTSWAEDGNPILEILRRARGEPPHTENRVTLVPTDENWCPLEDYKEPHGVQKDNQDRLEMPEAYPV